MAQSIQARARTTVSTSEILKFYLPIASTNMIIGIVFNVINSTMAGMQNAAAALAAFVIAQSMTDLMATLSSNSPSWLTARVRDRASFLIGLRTFGPLTLFNVALLALVAWTPIGRFIFGGVFRAPVELSDAISSALKVCVIMPFVLVLRGCSQSVLMVRKRTYLMFFGILARLASVVIVAPMLMRQSLLKGAQIGAFMWVFSMCVEAACDFTMALRHFHEYPAEPANALLPKPRQIWTFLMPLMAVSLIQTLGKPIQNLGMSLTTTPALSIAAYSVGWNGAWLLVAFAQDGIRQTMLVFWNDNESFVAIRRFFQRVALAVAAGILLLNVTGAWGWFFTNVIRADKDLAARARVPMYAFALFPLVISTIEMYTGRLLKNGQTTLMGLAKGANLLGNALAAYVITSLAPGAGALVGAGCVLSGLFAEMCVVFAANRRTPTRPLSID